MDDGKLKVRSEWSKTTSFLEW